MEKHLRKSDYKSMPWKNGLGTTVELAVSAHEPMPHDPTDVGSPFLWRISIASVSENGAFSFFPNIDRHLMILQGEGMVLEVAGLGDLRLDAPLQIVSFSGEAEVVARLHDGPLTDFNVMVDRRFAQAKVEVLAVVDETDLGLFDNGTSFLHVPDTSAAVVLSGDKGEVRIESGESYLLEGDEQQLSVHPAGVKPASLIRVKISSIPQT